MQKDSIKRLFNELITYIKGDSYYFKPLELDRFILKLEEIKREIEQIYERNTGGIQNV